jgi:MYXO-CTERM domain-containing protein
MKTRLLYASGLAAALLLAISGFIAGESRPTTTAFAQESTAMPTTGSQSTAAEQSAQPVEREDNDFPWGILGLLGLAGLAGLRSRPEPVRREQVHSTSSNTPRAGVYDATKK